MNTKCFRLRIPLTVVKCEQCDLVFLHPRPDKKLGIEYFDKAYSNAEGFEDIGYFRDDDAIFARNQERFKIISRIPAPNKKILDFGAGQGHFVKICRDEGWSAIGIEQSNEAIKKTKEQFGFDLLYDLSSLEKRSIEIITLWDVIEHLENPREILLMLSEYLVDDGHIVIETANINSFDFHIKKKKWTFWLMDHFYYYSNYTLKYLLNTLGFTLADYNSNESSPKPRKKRDLKKFLTLKNYIIGLKMFYYKRKLENVSNDPLMIVTAKLSR